MQSLGPPDTHFLSAAVGWCELGSVAEAKAAWDVLLPAVETFPEEPIIAYNLSCYACQLGRLDQARQWLQRAVKVAGKEKIKFMALNDDDLSPLWEEIEKL